MDRRKYLRLTGAVAAGSLIAGCADEGASDENGDENGDEENGGEENGEEENGNGEDGEDDESNGDGSQDGQPHEPEPGDGEGILELGLSVTGDVVDDFEELTIGTETVHISSNGEEETYELADIQGVDLTAMNDPDEVHIFQGIAVDAGEYSDLRIELHNAPARLADSDDEVEMGYPEGGSLEFDTEATVTEGETAQLSGRVTVVETGDGGYEVQVA